MAYSEHLAERVAACLRRQRASFEEKRMMGGLCFMVEGKMCLGINDERLMVRLEPADAEEAVKRNGCSPMDFTGRPLRGFLWVEPELLEFAAGLEEWVRAALEFNPRARPAKKSAARYR
jgi:TfoX/Sxy family transcriptional regulator of competence genes